MQKARFLSDAGQYDSCGPKACDVDLQNGLGGVINATAEHKECRLFKTLMTNTCSLDCRYCANRSGCGKRRVAYLPEELSDLFMHLHEKHRINGLFLSSGIAGDADQATERMLEAARLLRHRRGFRGYLHFKVLPGTSYELIKQASELATRMSVNIEAPNKQVLSELASNKDFKHDIIRRQAWVKRLRPPGGQSTQLIVNGLATDEDILRMMRWEYDEMELHRIYYSAFRPVPGTPLEQEKAVPGWREHRLYNADFLYRAYGFSFEELRSVMDGGMLPREDPKLVMARDTFDGPVDINEASYEELLRVPGIGLMTASRLSERRKRVTSYLELKRMGANLNLARPFIIVDGKRQRSLLDF